MIPLGYIASPSYSGSTLLTMLLNAHPELATVGELKWGAVDLGDYLCSCGALLSECPFWDGVERDLRGAGLPFDRARPHTDFRCRRQPLTDRIVRSRVRGPWFERARGVLVGWLPAARRTWPVVRAVNRAIILSVLRLQKGRVFVDASKDPVRLKHLMNTGDYSIRLLHLVRDGRGVVNSALKHGGAEARAAAREWRNTHGQIDRLARQIGEERRLVVRYEELCADPGETLGRIHDFLGVRSVRGVPDYGAAVHHVLGNGMRLKPSGEIRVDERWRTGLSAEALESFSQVAGARNQRHGYV